MRSIFFSLLTLNLVFFVYFVFQPPEISQVEPVPYEQLQIQLLSEQKGQAIRQLEAADILGKAVLGLETGKDLACQKRIGPFEDIDSAQDVAELINRAGFEAMVRVIDEPTQAFDYRVLIPAATSVQQAYRRLRELKSQDIDSYVMSRGEDSLAISLGVFPSKEAAVDHRLRLEDEGYNAQIREIPRFTRGYWVFVDNGIDFFVEKFSTAGTSDMRVEWAKTDCLN